MGDKRLVQALGYLGFEVSDIERWKTFAATIVGAMIGEPLADGSVALRLDERAFRFALAPASTDWLAFIGWEVADEADLVALEAQLVEAGTPAQRSEPAELAARQVMAMAWCIDPAGNRIEFFHGPADAGEPFVPGREMSGFLTNGLGLGHVVLQAADPPRTIEFYRDVLGFRLSDHLSDALYFLGCNPRHHSIGIANIGGDPRVLHVMLEALELDDVGRAFDLCVDEGIRASMIGLHTNDHMTSFYITTPSGFEIEYGWHGMLVDDATWTTGTIERPSVWGHRQLDMEHPPTRRRFQLVKPPEPAQS
jgi:2,3-dihydroxybiphenyl 1,2-dioxygenase